MLTLNDLQRFAALLSGYFLSDQDVKTTDADVQYYGYVNHHGEWYIMEEDTSVGGDANLKAWRFIKGDSAYSTAWTNRESLTYAAANEAFK